MFIIYTIRQEDSVYFTLLLLLLLLLFTFFHQHLEKESIFFYSVYLLSIFYARICCLNTHTNTHTYTHKYTYRHIQYTVYETK